MYPLIFKNNLESFEWFKRAFSLSIWCTFIHNICVLFLSFFLFFEFQSLLCFAFTSLFVSLSVGERGKGLQRKCLSCLARVGGPRETACDVRSVLYETLPQPQTTEEAEQSTAHAFLIGQKGPILYCCCFKTFLSCLSCFASFFSFSFPPPLLPRIYHVNIHYTLPLKWSQIKGFRICPTVYRIFLTIGYCDDMQKIKF